MPPRDPINWMLSEAIETLARAERLQQQFLNLQPLAGTHEPSWEPPIDVLETEQEILIFIALPGVDPNDVEALLEQGTLIISGAACFPKSCATPTFIASNCRRGGSSAAFNCRPAVTPSAVSPPMAA